MPRGHDLRTENRVTQSALEHIAQLQSLAGFEAELSRLSSVCKSVACDAGRGDLNGMNQGLDLIQWMARRMLGWSTLITPEEPR